MSKQILRDLDELTQAGVITEKTAEDVRSYYREKNRVSGSPLILVFGVLGALLIGLGIILIIAHNWDDLSRAWRIVWALIPLLLGQLACAYTLLKRSDSRVWREASSVFLFFSIAASIAIVSQVYNIPGNLSGFLLAWMSLSLPLIYLMQSAMTSLLFLIGITTYACSVGYTFGGSHETPWYYWLMYVGLLPFVVRLMNAGRGNFVVFHKWFLSLSLVITLGTFGDGSDDYILAAYMSLFSFFILLGELDKTGDSRLINNAFLITGSLGSMALLLSLTFDSFWTSIDLPMMPASETFLAAVVTTLVTAVLLLYSVRRSGARKINPKAWLFVVFVVLLASGSAWPSFTLWMVNLVVLVIAVLTTWRGAERNDMVLLNYGLIIMALLILCRFLDTNMDFIVRGILFLVVGFSFFGVNYWFLRRRKLQNS